MFEFNNIRTAPQTEQALFWQESHQTFLRVIRVLGPAMAIVIFALSIGDWIFYRDHFAVLFMAKLAAIFILILGHIVNHIDWAKAYVEEIGPAITFLLMLAFGYQVFIIDEPNLIALLIVFSLTTTATMFTWPALYQVILVAITTATIFLVYTLTAFPLFTVYTITAYIFSIATIFLMAYNNSRRFAFWQAEKKLAESEERFRQLGEHSQDIIWIWSPDRKLQYISPAYTHFTGRPPNSLYQNPLSILEIVHLDDRAKFGRFVEDVMQGHVRKMEIKTNHTDGSIFYLEGWGAPIFNQNGQVVRCVGIWRDVTERVRLAEELDAYAHIVAHDLKNPISLIFGYTELLEITVPDLAEGEAGILIDRISHGCQTMRQIIDELLLLASVRKLDDVEIGRLDMAAIVDRVQERLAHIIIDAQAEIITADHWPGALGYPAWIEEVWTNYISNAIKYGGSPPQIRLGSDPGPDQTIRFWVQDNGYGLDGNEKEQLFREFSRLQPAQGSGHGLGLSIVQRIISKLGGQVGIESAPGKGSAFWFTLPEYKDS